MTATLETIAPRETPDPHDDYGGALDITETEAQFQVIADHLKHMADADGKDEPEDDD